MTSLRLYRQLNESEILIKNSVYPVESAISTRELLRKLCGKYGFGPLFVLYLYKVCFFFMTHTRLQQAGQMRAVKNLFSPYMNAGP